MIIEITFLVDVCRNICRGGFRATVNFVFDIQIGTLLTLFGILLFAKATPTKTLYVLPARALLVTTLCRLPAKAILTTLCRLNAKDVRPRGVLWRTDDALGVSTRHG